MENVNVIAEGIVNLAIQDVVNRLAQTLKDKYGIKLIIKVDDSTNKDAAKKDSFDVILTEFNSKIQAIKTVKDICNLSLKEAVDIVDSTPVTIKHGIPKDEAEDLKKVFKQAYANVELVKVF